MFKNLNHALRWTFEVLERDITGYSNTAAIMRLGEQCGASASTSPDDLTIQEQKAQAVWISDLIFHNTTLQEYCAIELFYNPSVKNNNGDLVVIYNQLLFTSCIDVNLPEIDGFRLLSIIRSIKPDVKAVFISGSSNVNVARRAMAEGALRYFIKPFDVFDFISYLTEISQLDTA